MSNGGSVLISVSWASPWASDLPANRAADVGVFVRRGDWKLTRRQRNFQAALDAWRCFRACRGFDAVIVSTASVDAVVLAALLRLRPRQRFGVFDFLVPRSPHARRLSRWLLGRVDVWLVIRRGDASTFRRELGATNCRFVPFPAHHPAAPIEDPIAPFVYAAGTAYRDWPTLIEAAVLYRIPVVLSTIDHVELPPEAQLLVTLQPLNPANEGQHVIARAAAVCLPMIDTQMPSGPLVVLDALVAGKAIVASDVNGTRDYIEDGITGLLVPPGDAKALGAALRRVLDDHELRGALGDAARASAAAFDPGRILEAICREVLAVPARRPHRRKP